MVISSKDFDWVPGSMVRAKGPKKGRFLYESSTAPYDGMVRRVATYSCAEWNPEIQDFDPLIVFYGISGAFPLSDFEVVEKAG